MYSEIIKTQRKKRGWTQSDLAKKIGVTQGAINKYENGTNRPKYNVQIKLAKVFKIKPEKIFYQE